MSTQYQDPFLQPTSFIGREHEIAVIMKMLHNQPCRLVTLVGAGGIGKTRLAIAAAERFAKPLQEDEPGSWFPAGVFVVALEAINSANNIIPEIAGAMGFEFYDARDQERQLISHIANKKFLLLLDNLEHLPQAGAVISDLLSGASELKLLATSREPLNLPEEWLFHVEGMPFPGPDEDRVAGYDSVKMFVERARRVRYDFSLEVDAACVGRLCRLVYGQPLAIELAAAWMKRLDCQEIISEIERNLDILETDRRRVPERQRSMRAVLDYSWQLLTQAERELFMMLSVFRGGFRREAAEEITAANLQSLSALIDKSLLAAQSSGRFQLHPLHRQYAAERLALAVDLETAVRSRHCAYFAKLMDRPFSDYWGYQSIEIFAQIDADFENIQAAWNWALAQSRYSDLNSITNGLLPFWYTSWNNGVLKAYHDGLFALQGKEPSRERNLALGNLLAQQSNVDLWENRLQQAQERAEESIALLKPLNAQPELANALGTRARAVCWGQERDPKAAKAAVLEAVTLFEETGQYELQGLMYAMLGYLHLDIGKLAESAQWFQKDLELSRKIDDPLGKARSMGNLGENALIYGRYRAANQLLLESLEIATKLRNKSWINEVSNRLGLVAVAVGDFDTAERTFQECLQFAKEWGKPLSIARSMANLAAVTVVQKDYAQATALFQEAATYSQGRGLVTAYKFLGLGRIAFEQGQLGQAQRHLDEGLRICEVNGFGLQMTGYYIALGRVSLALGLISKARLYFKGALEKSIAVGASPLILESVLAAGELAASEAQMTQAQELATLVMNHRASKAESKAQAAELLEKIGKAVSTASQQSFRISSDEDDLEQVAVQLLANLSSGEGLAASSSEPVPPTLVDPLSEREQELLLLVAQGKSNREIAAELFISLGTVKSHLHNIYQKLGAGSRTQAVAQANELGLL